MIRKPSAVIVVTGLTLVALVLLPAALGAKGGNGGGNPDRGGGGGDTVSVDAAGLAGKGGNGDNPNRGGGGGKGGGGSSYSVTVDPSGPYYFGQAVHVTTNAPVYPDNAGPWISLACYQDGFKVGGADHAGFAGGWYYGDPFYLGPSTVWTGGAADCTVEVFHLRNSKKVTDATTSFHVEP